MRLSVVNMRFRHYSILVASMLLIGFLASCKQEEPEPVIDNYCFFSIWNESTHSLSITIHSKNPISDFWNTTASNAISVPTNTMILSSAAYSVNSKTTLIGHDSFIDEDMAQNILSSILGDSISLVCDGSLIAVWKQTDLSANNIYSFESWQLPYMTRWSIKELPYNLDNYRYYITKEYVDSLLEIRNIQD